LNSSTARTRVGVFYPSDPVGHIPGGIDSYLRGILRYAPAELEYTLIGATSDPVARPVGQPVVVPGRFGVGHFLPLIPLREQGLLGRLPLTVRYMRALRAFRRTADCAAFDILDFQRIEPVALFARDRRPINVLLHQDMTVLRDPKADIGWRHAPWLYDAIERRLLTRASRVFCVRESAVSRYREMYPERADRFGFVPTWVDTETFSPGSDAVRASLRRAKRVQIEAPEDTRLLVSVGRLDSQKDPLLMIEAMARAVACDPRLRLVMFGDGVLRESVEAAIESHRLRSSIRLMGVAQPREIASWLRAADAFLMTSAYEGMPIAALEALACGVPVVSTAVGELPRLVLTGVTGALAERRTAEAVAAAIVRALDLDPLTACAFCARAAAPFSPETVLGMLYVNHRNQAGPKVVDPNPDRSVEFSTDRSST